jgi:hypothetical protein
MRVEITNNSFFTLSYLNFIKYQNFMQYFSNSTGIKGRNPPKDFLIKLVIFPKRY